jgi:uncharacterized protein YqgC (DUF456 family)
MFNITLHESNEIFTVPFSVSAMTEFINIRNFTSLFLKDATCYRIIVATFGIDDLNSVWCTEYYAGSKKTISNFLCSIDIRDVFYILID